MVSSGSYKKRLVTKTVASIIGCRCQRWRKNQTVDHAVGDIVQPWDSFRCSDAVTILLELGVVGGIAVGVTSTSSYRGDARGQPAHQPSAERGERLSPGH